MACVTPRGIINNTAWDAKLIVTANLAFPVSCASMGHLLIAQHCPFVNFHKIVKMLVWNKIAM